MHPAEHARPGRWRWHHRTGAQIWDQFPSAFGEDCVIRGTPGRSQLCIDASCRVSRKALAPTFAAPAIRLDDTKLNQRPIRFQVLPHSLKPEFLELAERGQWLRGDGSVGHVEVFRKGSVRASIPRGPYPRLATDALNGLRSRLGRATEPGRYDLLCAGILKRVDIRDEFLKEVSGGYSVQSGVFGAISPKIVTELNEYGQYEARISADLSDEELHKLASVSVMANSELNEDVLSDRIFSDTPGVKYQDLVGYYHGLFAGYVRQGDLRANGSSGGIATWILLQLLRRGLVDGVIHAQASTGSGEVLFEYSISTSEEEILAGAKSRYYPMDLSKVLTAAKAGGGRYAVTGIPSFIAELRLLAEADPDFKRIIAFTVGLICGHQKSTKYVEAIAWEQGISPGNLVGVDFRKKIEGSSADEYITELRAGSGKNELVMVKKADQVFVSSWSHGFFKAKFSDFTDDLFNETADIALGDAWLPRYSDDYRGTNLVIVRNNELAQILQEGLRDGELHLDELTPEDVIRSQPGLVRHAYDELPYRLHRADRRAEWRPHKRLETSHQIGAFRRKIQDIREQIAEQSHLHYQKAVELDDWSYFVKKMKPLVDQHNALYSLTDTKRLLRKGPRHLLQKAYREVVRRLRATNH